ncbi:hypothetical protein CMK19_05780 [Candidatus Poribacteria bacterium]|nr:hypothetical protein [Candidatus Poribacteria bacterium]MEE2911366.1 hypothetical protein [Candidatus Poribacteria bacterium]
MQLNSRRSLIRLINFLVIGIPLVVEVRVNSNLSAENYYPDNIGNEWVFLSTDGLEERVLRIQANTETNYRQLVDQTREVRPPQEETGYSRFVIQPGTNSIKIMKATFTFGLVGEIDLPYTPPQVFLPIPIQLGAEWSVKGSVKLPLLGQIQAENRQKAVAIETVSVPVGTFEDCLKITQNNALKSPVLGMELTGTMWLAPDLGPVKLISSGDIVFELIRHNIKTATTAVSLKTKLATKWSRIRNE